MTLPGQQWSNVVRRNGRVRVVWRAPVCPFCPSCAAYFLCANCLRWCCRDHMVHRCDRLDLTPALVLQR